MARGMNNINNIKINMDEAVCPVYKKLVYRALKDEVDEIVLKGGRSSMKSSALLTIGILKVLYTKRSAIFIVRHGNAVKKRLMAPIKKVLRRLGILSAFKENKSNNEFELIGYPGVKIQCIGADDPDNIKSMASETIESYCFVGFEEVNNFRSLQDVLNIQATFIRADNSEHQLVMYAFNPKRVQNDWCNNEFDRECGKSLGFKTNVVVERFNKVLTYEVNGVMTDMELDTKRVIFHSTIYDIIECGWVSKIGLKTVADAEKLKEKDPATFKWMWLGANVPIPGVRIFSNIVEWDGNRDTCFDELGLDEVYRGLDFGQGQHYSAYVEAMFDEENMIIYPIAEYGEIGVDFRNFCKEVLKVNKYNFPIKCDYATVLAREQCEKYGLNLESCYKPEREMRYKYFSDDIKYIYINPELTPMLYKTLKAAEYVLNAQGDITSKPSKENDDFIDAFMYAFSDVLRNR